MSNKLRFFDVNAENNDVAHPEARQEESEESNVVYPRLFQLRELQASEGLKLRNLRKEQRGVASVPFFHHISKVTEGKIDSYRVRICRSCSGLPTLLELGSYADEESAMLLNDAHEIMQGRTKQLHILVPEDVKYLGTLAIRRRGATQDLPLLNILQERLWKCQSKRSADEVPQFTSSFSIPKVEEDVKRQRLELSKISSAYITSSDVSRPDNSLFNVFRANLELVRTVIPLWSLSSLAENVLVAMLGEFMRSLEAALVPHGENVIIPELAASTQSTQAFERLVHLAQVPRGLFFTIITSMAPLSISDIYYLHRRLHMLLHQDAPTANTYRTYFESAYHAIIAHHEDDQSVMELCRYMIWFIWLLICSGTPIMRAPTWIIQFVSAFGMSKLLTSNKRNIN